MYVNTIDKPFSLNHGVTYVSSHYLAARHTAVDSWRMDTVGLPKGSLNSKDDGRMNLSAFLVWGGVCPIGYDPGCGDCLLEHPDAQYLKFVVVRPQDMAASTASGYIACFICGEDLVAEAQEAGVHGIRKVMQLPFAKVELVMVNKEEAPYSSLDKLLLYSSAPVRCISELPFLARKAFCDESCYMARFGVKAPCIEYQQLEIVDGNDKVRVIRSEGSSEAWLAQGCYDCAVVITATGRTIEKYRLKVIKHLGTFYPALFAPAQWPDEPALCAELEWFMDGLRVAKKKWPEIQRHRSSQLELPFF